MPNSPIQKQVGWGSHKKVEGSYLRQIVPSNLKKIMGISDTEYVQKWDNINKQLDGKPFTIENLEQIDKEMADAYKIFLSKANNAQEYKDDCVLRNSNNVDYSKQVWNEFLVSKPKISGIYMNASKIEDLRTLYGIENWLKFAQENNIPIILLKTS